MSLGLETRTKTMPNPSQVHTRSMPGPTGPRHLEIHARSMPDPPGPMHQEIHARSMHARFTAADLQGNHRPCHWAQTPGSRYLGARPGPCQVHTRSMPGPHQVHSDDRPPWETECKLLVPRGWSRRSSQPQQQRAAQPDVLTAILVAKSPKSALVTPV